MHLQDQGVYQICEIVLEDFKLLLREDVQGARGKANYISDHHFQEEHTIGIFLHKVSSLWCRSGELIHTKRKKLSAPCRMLAVGNEKKIAEGFRSNFQAPCRSI